MKIISLHKYHLNNSNYKKYMYFHESFYTNITYKIQIKRDFMYIFNLCFVVHNITNNSTYIKEEKIYVKDSQIDNGVSFCNTNINSINDMLSISYLIDKSNLFIHCICNCTCNTNMSIPKIKFIIKADTERYSIT